MSDPTDATTGRTASGKDEAPDSVPDPKPRPTSAASRARRIGGRTTAAPAPTGSRSTGDQPAPTTADAGDQQQESDTSESVKAAVDDAVRGARPRLRKTPTATVSVPAAPTSSDVSAEAKDSADTGSGRRVALLNWLPATVLLAGVIAMAVVVIVVSHGVWWGKRQQGPDETNKLRDQVTAAAKTCMARLNSYDYRTLDTFAKAGRTCATGQELTKFEQAVTDVLKKQAPAVKGTQALQISTTGVESVVGDQWTLLVYGQVKVTNVSAPKGRIDPFAASITMDKVHGTWLVSNQQVVSGLS